VILARSTRRHQSLATVLALVVPFAAPARAAEQVVPEESAQVLRLMSEAFASVSEHVSPFVVQISTETEVPPEEDPHALPGFREFFGDRFGLGEGFTQRGLGSGVIVTADGYILTNNHVAGDADALHVRLHDGHVYAARLIGADNESDLAVVKVDVEGALAFATLGDSDRLRVGEWVIAVGSPFHLEQTVTAGIVSAKGRTGVQLTQYEDFIQTDAAINPGNSGGPLVNLEGDVIGINTAIATRTGGYQGVGFAIPINMARGIMNDLIQEGRVIRGWLGVTIANLDQDLAESLGLRQPAGALVQDTDARGAAREGGILAGDVILRFDGELIRDMPHLRNRVAMTRPGRNVEVVVNRRGHEETLHVTLRERETFEPPVAAAPAVAPFEEWEDPFGLELTELTPDQALDLDTTLGSGGLVVESVSHGGIADQKGVRAGDIVRHIGSDRAAVRSVAEYRRIVDALRPDETLLLMVERDGRTRFLAVRKPA